jgi:hypothetical protein
MRTKFSRQTWSFDPNYTRIEALDDAGQPLGYVYFVRRTHRRLETPKVSSLLTLLPQLCGQVIIHLLGNNVAC